MDYKDKNIQALHENQKMMNPRITELETKMQVMENNMALLHAEIMNLKQLVGFVQGRGTGSTVHN